MNEPLVEPILAHQSEPAFESRAPLIPGDSVMGRALVVVIAIMTFLACLTAGAALLVAEASQAWRSDVLRDATIQVKPRSGDDVESLVAKAVAIATKSPRVDSARALSKAESERLLEPWLGSELDLSQLPIPRLILVRLRGQPSEDLSTLRSALATAVPEADLDDHRVWAARLGTMASAVVTLAAALFVLMIVAMGAAIGFATHGAVAGNREIVEVLHLVGASNAFIAREFEFIFVASDSGARRSAASRRSLSSPSLRFSPSGGRTRPAVTRSRPCSVRSRFAIRAISRLWRSAPP